MKEEETTDTQQATQAAGTGASEAPPATPARARKRNRAAARPRATDRDRQLVAVLSIARYLSEQQVGELFFRRRHRTTLQKRLMMLAGAGSNAFRPPLLRRLQYRLYTGETVPVWTLADAGHWLAEQVLTHPSAPGRGEVGAEFLEHTVLLNEVLVRLLRPETADTDAAAYPRARQAEERFRWFGTEAVRLPWREYDAKDGASRPRLIVPDAVLELPHRQQRLLLECERGTHSLQAVSPEKAGATTAKLDRYQAFCSGRDVESGARFALQAYPDGWAMELLFVAPTQTRVDGITRTIAHWRRRHPDARLQASALTVSQAGVELRARLPEAASAQAPAVSFPPPPAFTDPARPGAPALAAELFHFVGSALEEFKRLRASARAHGLPPPAYPRGTDAARAWVQHATPLIEGTGASR